MAHRLRPVEASALLLQAVASVARLQAAARTALLLLHKEWAVATVRLLVVATVRPAVLPAVREWAAATAGPRRSKISISK